jgi:hypothetical protein
MDKYICDNYESYEEFPLINERVVTFLLEVYTYYWIQKIN